MLARLRTIPLLALAVGLVACGSGGTGGNPQPSTGPSTTPSVAQLQSGLLTAREVGANWQLGEPINPADLAAFAQIPCDGASLQPAVAERLTAVAGVQFDPADRSYRHLIELVVTGGSAQLGRDLTSLFSAVTSCNVASPAGGHKMTVAALAIPELGDQRAAYRVTQAREAPARTTLLLRIGYVRIGTVAVALGLADFDPSAQGGSPISDRAYVALLESAAAKLGGR